VLCYPTSTILQCDKYYLNFHVSLCLHFPIYRSIALLFIISMMGDPYSTSAFLDSSCFSLLYPLYNMNRQQPYPTPIQQRRGPPSKRVAPHRIGPTGQREILSNAVGIVPPNLKAFATASQALAQNETTVKPGQASREELLDSSFISRMYSGQIPNQSFPANRLVTALGRELQSNTIEADDYFINHLFPASLLPSGMGDQAMLEELSKPHEGKPSIWNEKEECFRVTPSALNEKHLAAWLNSIGTTLGKAFNYEPLRLWTHISCDEAPLGSNIKRKPDLILLDKKYYDTMSKSIEKVDWAFIRAIAEVTSTDKMTQRIIDTVNTKAYLMYLCQYNRRFVVALSFTAAEGQSFRLTVTDREGQVKWTVGLDGARSKERAALFLRILVVLMFGTSANIGLDPNVEIDGTTGKCVAITLQEKRFEVVDLIYSLDSIVGRGTRVWVVMYNDVKYALKDCWIQHERVDSEISMLKKMKTGEKLTDRVPTLFCGGDVQIDGKIDSTALYRYGLPGWSSKGRRIHRRLVCTPIGEALPEYRSKQEFIKAIISIIISASLPLTKSVKSHHKFLAHKTLFNDYGILHRDISLNNILLNRHNVDGAADGLLIDFDYSEELELIDANREQAIEECEAEINEEADAAKAVTGPSRLSAFDSIRTVSSYFINFMTMIN
jgi:hypothetical protein